MLYNKHTIKKYGIGKKPETLTLYKRSHTMKKENIKESINVTRKESTLNIDYTSVLIDKTLQESASIMYIRQATYYFLLRLNGWTRTDLHKAIKTPRK